MIDVPPKVKGVESAKLPDGYWESLLAGVHDAKPGTAAKDFPFDSSSDVDVPPSGSSVDAISHETSEDMRANRELRIKFSDKAYSLAFHCLWWWGGMIFAHGFVNGIRGNELWSDKVIIAVTTGVTVSVLAAFLGVIRGLFPNGDSKKKA